MMLKQKRKVWHEAMMPDVDRHVDKKISDLSENFNVVLESKLQELERLIAEKDSKTTTNSFNTFMRREREREGSRREIKLTASNFSKPSKNLTDVIGSLTQDEVSLDVVTDEVVKKS